MTNIDVYANDFTTEELLKLREIKPELLREKALQFYQKKHGCFVCGKANPKNILELKFHHDLDRTMYTRLFGNCCSFECFREYITNKKDLETGQMIFDNTASFAFVLGSSLSLKELEKLDFQRLIDHWTQLKKRNQLEKAILDGYEQNIEQHSQRFVVEIIKEARRALQNKRIMEILSESGYANNKDGFCLTGYDEESEYIKQLTPSELQKFVFVLLNAMHQAAYHVSDTEIFDFIRFNKESRVFNKKK